MKEIWLDIKGFECFYQVSNLGNIKSVDRYIEQRDINGNLYSRFIKGKMLSLNKNNGNGYITVSLRKGCKSSKRNYYIHRLVADAFLLNLDNKLEVNHKDGNKQNNNVDNLEWCTRSENEKHAYDNGLNIITEYAKGKLPKGSQHHMTNINEEQAKEIYDLANRGDLKEFEIGKLFNISRKTVNNIKLKNTWKHIHVINL